MTANSLPEEALVLRGPVGDLEALLRRTPQAAPAVAALLCHPHPLHGGTMMNKTLYRIAKRLPTEAGVPALRFNFRGTGSSAGVHDGGPGEVADTAAALEALADLYPTAALVAVGYSFGAAIGLQAAVADDAVVLLVALGLPLALEWDLHLLRTTPKPLVVVQGDRDEFGNRRAIEAWMAKRDAPGTLHIVPGADHLFQGREDEAVERVVAAVRAVARGAGPRGHEGN